MGVEQCQPVELPVVEDPQGNLAFAEAGRHLPFPIARVYFVYGVPRIARRGGHAHRTLEQAIFCVAGRMDVEVDDGGSRRQVTLDDPCRGLYVPPMVWHDLTGFAEGTAYAVIASAPFDEGDYIHSFELFERLAQTGGAEPDA